MKSQTAELFKKHLDEGRFQFAPSSSGVQFDYELTDEEVKELVEAEYGTTFVGPIEDLFKAIVKKVISKGIDYAKKSN